MQRKFRIGIIDPFPEDPTPEKEIIARANICEKYSNLYELFIIDKNGTLLRKKYKRNFCADKLDFIIIFDPKSSPPLFKCPTYFPLWLPIGFVSNIHAKGLLDNLPSISDCLDSYENDAIYNDYNNIISDTGHLLPKLFISTFINAKLFVIKPKILKNPRLFYVGLNNERNKNSKVGRYNTLFKILTRKNLIKIYGPNNGSWDNFKSYKGKIAFDGISIFEKINDTGVVLAIHHDIHREYGLPTNRLFEGCIAGAIIITDDLPIFRRIFGDTIFYVDLSSTVENVSHRIIKIMRWIKNNPIQARQKALDSQKIFLDKFGQYDYLDEICNNHYARIASISANLTNLSKKVTVIVNYRHHDIDDIKELCEQINIQSTKNIEILFVCLENFKNDAAITFSKFLDNKSISLKIIPLEQISSKDIAPYTGNVFFGLKEYINGDYFCFLDPNCGWSYDHLSSLIFTIEKTPTTLFSYSGIYFKYPDHNTREILNNLPITQSQITDLRLSFDTCIYNDYQTYSLYDLIAKINLSYLKTEASLLKSACLFKKEALNFIDDRIKIFDGSEHIFIIFKLILENQAKNILFSHKLSCSLNIIHHNDTPDEIIYPYRKSFIHYNKSHNSTNMCLYKVFKTNQKFNELLFLNSSTIPQNINITLYKFNLLKTMNNSLRKLKIKFTQMFFN